MKTAQQIRRKLLGVNRLSKHNEHETLVSNCTALMMQLDYEVTYRFDSERITLMNRIEISTPNGTKYVVSADDVAGHPVAIVLTQLTRVEVTDAWMSRSTGVLTMEFADGTILTACTKDGYEGWSYSNEDTGRLLVASPDGDIAEFPGTDDEGSGPVTT